jgi:hypothetical protein
MKTQTALSTRFNHAIRKFNKYIFNRMALLFSGGRFTLLSIIEHQGRVSGRRYRTPVVAIAEGDFSYTPLPYGDDDVDWLLNVLSHGSFRLKTDGIWRSVADPTVMVTGEVLPALPERYSRTFRRFKVEKFLRGRVRTDIDREERVD